MIDSLLNNPAPPYLQDFCTVQVRSIAAQNLRTGEGYYIQGLIVLKNYSQFPQFALEHFAT